MLETLPPLLTPAFLLLAGSGAAMAAWRRRHAPRAPRVVRAIYAVLAVTALTTGGWLAADRAQRFGAARWDDGRQQLVLDHPFPIPDTELPLAEVKEITELQAPIHTAFGIKRAAEFEIATRGGRSYWSLPVYRERDRRLLLAALRPASGGRLARMLVGRAQLPN